MNYYIKEIVDKICSNFYYVDNNGNIKLPNQNDFKDGDTVALSNKMYVKFNNSWIEIGNLDDILYNFEYKIGHENPENNDIASWLALLEE